MGIESEQVLQAMLKVPRHYFLDSSFEDFAYQNKAFPIGTEQTTFIHTQLLSNLKY